MILEQLERSAQFFRVGMRASGCVSYLSFMQNPARLSEDDPHVQAVDAALERSDLLGVADIIEYGILPIYKETT